LLRIRYGSEDDATESPKGADIRENRTAPIFEED
jgi:hypothetical protein